MISAAILAASLTLTATQSAVLSDYVGINQDLVWTQADQIEPLIAKTRAAGVGWVRLPIRWTVVQNAGNASFNFSRVDPLVERLKQSNIRILGLLMSVPRWASGVTDEEAKGGFPDSFMPRNLNDWSRYVHETVAHYRDSIDYWEIWNEENGADFFRPLPSATDYVRLLASANREIKHSNPRAVTVLGGLQMNGILPNPWSPVKVENFLQQIYNAGGREHFDIINIHPYILATDSIEKMVDMVQGTVEVAKVNGDAAKPIWITECGSGMIGDPSGTLQARLLESTFQEMAKIPQVGKVFWFCLRDYERDITGPESSMGVLRTDLSEKPAYTALARMAAQFSGKEAKVKEMAKILFEDDFERYNEGTIKLQGWLFESGQWRVQVDRETGKKVLAQTRDYGDNMYALVDQDFSGDFRLETRFKMTGSNRWGCGLVARYQDYSNLYQFEAWDTNNFLRFWVWKNGRYDAPGGCDLPAPLQLNKWYDMVLEGRDETFTCTLEPGGYRFEAKDSNYKTGKIGFNAAGAIMFDYLRLLNF